MYLVHYGRFGLLRELDHQLLNLGESEQVINAMGNRILIYIFRKLSLWDIGA